jgi:Cell division protein ZapA.
MADQNKLHIRLHVYDEEIEVVIKREDEEFYRLAAKLITERYNAYAQAYKGRKSEHTISLMTLVDIALLYQKEHSHNDTAPYDDVLARLTAEIGGCSWRPEISGVRTLTQYI